MPDRTESKVRQWALKRNGDPIEMKDIIEFGLAIDDDGVDRHVETMDNISELKAQFEAHCRASEERDRRIDELDKWRSGCPATVQKTVEDFHRKYHAEYVENLSDDTERKTWVMWGVGTKLGAALITIIVAIVVTIINLGLNYAWFGNP